MQRGCFVWTPTPPLSGQRTPSPGPARVCVRAPLGQVGRASVPGAFWCASPTPWPSCPSSLFSPHQTGVARALGVFFFFVFLPSFPLPSCAPVVSGFLCFPAPGALGLGAPRSLPPLALCLCVLRFLPPCPSPPPLCFFPRFCFVHPPPFAVFFFPSFSSGVFPLLTPPSGPWCCCFRALGLGGVLCSPPISHPFFFPSFFLFFLVFPLPLCPLSAPLVCPLFRCFRPWVPWAWALCLRPPLPPSLSLRFFFSFFLFVFWFFFLVFFSSLPLFAGFGRSRCSWPLVRLAGFLLPSPCAAVRVVRAMRAGAAICVVSCWCCPVASFALAGAVCCCLWLRGVRCWVWLSVVVLRWRALARVVLSGRVARRPAVSFGLLWLPCAVSCVLWLCVAVWPRAVVRAVRFALLCGRCGTVLLLGAVCGAFCFSLGGVLCPRRVPPFVRCWVWLPACRVVSFALAGAVCCCLWLPAVRCWVWLPAVVFLWRVLPRLILPGCVACCSAVCCGSLWCQFGVHCRWCLVLWCVAASGGASLGVLWCGGAALVCRGVLLCRAVFFGAVLPCGAVLQRCAVCFALLWALVFAFKAIFLFLKIKIKKIKQNKIILYPTHARRQAAIPRSLC